MTIFIIQVDSKFVGKNNSLVKSDEPGKFRLFFSAGEAKTFAEQIARTQHGSKTVKIHRQEVDHNLNPKRR